jgi:hypothetical protein
MITDDCEGLRRRRIPVSTSDRPDCDERADRAADVVPLGRQRVLDPDGTWATLPGGVRSDAAVALVVDECALTIGAVRQVIARGRAELLPFDVPRGRRKLTGYLGADETRWDERFRRYLHDDPAGKGTTWLRLRPASLTARDLSYAV